ncbi:MAG: FkbM family methyltransferase [Candidatus Omnitrophica bacterium]|nr:FkbM family methyltransferase [Candidatus Omnitrophota bacterium]
MSNYSQKLSFVIATKDRPTQLRDLLKSLIQQSRLPDEVVVIDAGIEYGSDIAGEFPGLRIRYFRSQVSSISSQRNAGIQEVSGGMNFIGFLDDDVVLEKEAIEEAMKYFNDNNPEVGGVAFTMANHPRLFASFLKSLPLARRLGLYSRTPGVVLRSGFQTMIGAVSVPMQVEWLPTGAVIWRKEVFSSFLFDEYFSGYSYLEDLDFSYRAAKRYRLMVIPQSRYLHYPPLNGGRSDEYLFGKQEVSHRLYFVRKNASLSLARCYMALLLKIIVNLGLALRRYHLNLFYRIAGNIVGLFQSVLNEKKIPQRVVYYVVYSIRRKKLISYHGIPISVVVPNFSEYLVATSILSEGGLGEAKILSALLQSLQPGDVAYDIGAHTGILAIFMAKVVGDKGRIFAFEPASKNYQRLLTNIRLNRLSNLTALQVALGNTSGMHDLYYREDIGSGAQSMRKGPQSYKSESVSLAHGDRFVAEHCLLSPRAVKIDVEGYEYEVIQGLRQILSGRQCKMLCCEFHPGLLPQGITVSGIMDLLRECGFIRKETFVRGSEIHGIFYKDEGNERRKI